LKVEQSLACGLSQPALSSDNALLTSLSPTP